ncbi:glycosyl hydrolase family 28-related protein [Planosporangium sp. 12N6]|uniref:glycosyl hydrolase family 28-related protein n=1 Tax=Planosporangium spinosum TaxID=3402278 RepID=UPI003CF0A378
MATAALTVISLVGGLAVALTAGVGVRPVSQAAAEPPSPVVRPPAAVTAPTPEPTPTGDPALDSPRLRFPADAVVDVKAAYHAMGDGSTDDTAALQAAISENPGRTIYLPAGTYLVSKTLEARDKAGRSLAGLRLVGEERNSTVIKLKDRAAGFGDHWNARPLLRTGTASVTGVGRAGSASGYGNQLENFTVDTGANPGANGIDYTGSNVASIRRLTITGQGPTGLSITRGLPGPALISRFVVKGFDYGIRVAQGRYGLTLEHLNLSGQKIAGIDNAGNVLAIRDLASANTVPAIRSTERGGFISLVDATLTGGTADFSGVQSIGELMLRRVRTTGYRSVLTQSGKIVSGTELPQYSSKTPVAPFPEAQSLATDLQVREAPEFVDAQPADWVSVTAYGAKPDDNTDDTAAFQKALDSGKPVVYLPTGRYVISKPLHVKGAVRQFVGFGSTLTPTGTAWGDAAAPAAVIQVDDGTARDVTISGITIARAPGNGTPTAGLVGFAQRTARPLVLKDVDCCGDAGTSYQAQAGVGPLYLENVSASGWQFDQPQQVWARQFNHLDRGTAATGTATKSPLLVNAGATVWVLGLETERRGPLMRTERGGRTEVLGGAVYESSASADDIAFECLDGASMSLSFTTMGPGNGGYRVLARQRRGEVTKDLRREQAYWRGDGRTVPLYAG